jgi:hypothetical protein
MAEKSILEGAYDFVSGVFKDYVDYERGRDEFELAKASRAFATAEQRRQAPSGSPTFGVDQNLIIWGLVAVVAAVMLPRFLKS